MLPTNPLRIPKRHGLATVFRAHECPIALLVLLITCSPTFAIAAKPNMASDYLGQVENAGKLDKVMTSLRWSAKGTSGTYVLTDQISETKGRLRDCKPLSSQRLKT